MSHDYTCCTCRTARGLRFKGHGPGPDSSRVPTDEAFHSLTIRDQENPTVGTAGFARKAVTAFHCKAWKEIWGGPPCLLNRSAAEVRLVS